MINIVLPIAGRGSRFSNAGYDLPKPLIKIYNKSMIEVVVNNIRPLKEHRFIFVTQQEHLDHLEMGETLNKIAPDCIIVPVSKITDGAACTVLLAKEYIDNKDELMIANSDQWVDIDINVYLEKMNSNNLDGLIMTMKASDPKWSFVSLNEFNNVNKVVEKEVISNEATVGIYNFKNGDKFVKYAEEMITNNERVNNEFYVAPVYNRFIKNSAKIEIFNIGEEMNGMYGLGIPEDLKKFLSLEVSKIATNF
jgi:dTDP-glucose pyrophosphorylase